MPMCVLFLIWPRDPLYYQIFLFFSIFWTFEADLRVIHTSEKQFSAKNIPKSFQKKSNLLQFVRMIIGVLSPPSTSVDWYFIDYNGFEIV